MIFRNTTRAWGVVSKTFHWVIVLLIITQWLIAERADDLPNGLAKLRLLDLHKSIGMSVFMLAILRLVWRWMNPVPTLEGLTTRWERHGATLSHVALYALIFAMPITGWLMSSAHAYSVSWFHLFQWPDLVQPDHELSETLETVHKRLFLVLAGVALLHVLGALKHHVIDRNEVLKRMLPFGGVK
jgi:cytochrome b561